MIDYKDRIIKQVEPTAYGTQLTEYKENRDDEFIWQQQYETDSKMAYLKNAFKSMRVKGIDILSKLNTKFQDLSNEDGFKLKLIIND